MIFTDTKLKGVFIIEIERQEDERGFFARTWDQKKFEEADLNSRIAQCSISFNKKKGTLRGMHYQINPYDETKLVRCTRGKIFDVILDLRPQSTTFKKWIGIELSANNYKILYIPEGFAHGFQTLEDNTEVFYQISQEYMPDFARGIPWNDSMFQIKWPLNVSVISSRDSSFKQFEDDS